MSDLQTAPVRSTKFIGAGNATFTVEVSADFAAKHHCQPWYTYNVSLWPADENPMGRDVWNVSLLSGPNNTADYTYLGQLNPNNGDVRLTKSSRLTVASWPVRILRRVLFRLFADQMDQVTAAGWDLKHAGRCCRCGRKLTTPRSVETGIGPVCENLI